MRKVRNDEGGDVLGHLTSKRRQAGREKLGMLNSSIFSMLKMDGRFRLITGWFSHQMMSNHFESGNDFG